MVEIPGESRTRPGRDREAPGAAPVPHWSPAAASTRVRARTAAPRRRRRRSDQPGSGVTSRPTSRAARSPTSPATDGAERRRTGAPFASPATRRTTTDQASESPSPSESPSALRVARRRPSRPSEPAAPTTSAQDAAGLDGQPRPGLDRRLQRLHLPGRRRAAVVDDDPDKPLVTCGDARHGVKYLLSPAVIEGTDLTTPPPAVPQDRSSGRSTSTSTATATEDVRATSPARMVGTEQAVRDRPRRPGHLRRRRSTGVITDGSAADHRRLQRGRARRAWPPA